MRQCKIKKRVKHYKITRSVFCFPILASLDRNARNSAISGHKFWSSNTCLKLALKTVNYLDFQAPRITVAYEGNEHLNFRKFLSNIKKEPVAFWKSDVLSISWSEVSKKWIFCSNLTQIIYLEFFCKVQNILSVLWMAGSCVLKNVCVLDSCIPD